MENKLVVITGGSDGLGLEAAKEFCRRGARVVIACRNVEKGERACDAVREAAHQLHCDVQMVHMDTGDFESVRQCVKRLQKLAPAGIDVIVNNAGVGGRFPYRANPCNADGIETIFAVNYLGHDLFIRSLIFSNLLGTVPDCRVVSVSSVVHHGADSNFEYASRTGDEKTYVGAYARSKLAQIISTFEFARKQDETGGFSNGAGSRVGMIKFVALHPGAVRSSIWRNDVKGSSSLKTMSRWQMLVEKAINWLVMHLFVAPSVASRAIVDACCEQKFSVRNDGSRAIYLTPGIHEATGFGVSWFGIRETKPSAVCLDIQKGKSLWKLSEQLAPV